MKNCLLCLLTIFHLSPAQATDLKNEIISELADQTDLAVTIYNEDLALIKDTRKLNLTAKNESTDTKNIAFRDVSARIKPETALLRSLVPNNILQVLEQNFDFDLLTPQKMLEKFVGQQVRIIKTNPSSGIETEETATVLSAQNGVVLKMANHIETGIPGRIVYPSVPKQLRDRPTLVTQVQFKGSENNTVELSYLTGGLKWKVDYVAELNAKEEALDLSGWVTLTNTSGTSYPNAKLQLVAGDVNRVQADFAPRLRSKRAEVLMAEAATMPSEESLLEYHLYTLPRNTTIAENQTKQVALLSAQQIPAKKELVLMGADYYYNGRHEELGKKLKVSVFIQFDNKETSKLGLPLPKGIIRVYKNDSQGRAQFVGEDHIDHTEKNASLRLKLGNAFDVTANKVQTDFKNLTDKTNKTAVYESAYDITVHNAKKERVTILVQEPIGGDWRIIRESHPHKKTNSHLATWSIEIAPESEAKLSYRALVQR